MEELEIWELAIIGFVIFAKFAIIIGAVLWSKSNQEKKKRLFLAEQERIKILRQSAQSETF